jgi:hypothetical protein
MSFNCRAEVLSGASKSNVVSLSLDAQVNLTQLRFDDAVPLSITRALSGVRSPVKMSCVGGHPCRSLTFIENLLIEHATTYAQVLPQGYDCQRLELTRQAKLSVICSLPQTIIVCGGQHETVSLNPALFRFMRCPRTIGNQLVRRWFIT